MIRRGTASLEQGRDVGLTIFFLNCRTRLAMTSSTGPLTLPSGWPGPVMEPGWAVASDAAVPVPLVLTNASVATACAFSGLSPGTVGVVGLGVVFERVDAPFLRAIFSSERERASGLGTQ